MWLFLLRMSDLTRERERSSEPFSTPSYEMLLGGHIGTFRHNVDNTEGKCDSAIYCIDIRVVVIMNASSKGSVPPRR